MRERNKAEQITKRIILKDNMTTTHIQHEHKNTGTSVLIHSHNAENQNY